MSTEQPKESDNEYINRILAELEADPAKAEHVARLLQPREKSTVKSYEVKVRHTMTCRLCDNVYHESYRVPYKQHMAKGAGTEQVEQVNYEHKVETCHDCHSRLIEMGPDRAITRAIDRIRTLSRGGS